MNHPFPLLAIFNLLIMAAQAQTPEHETKLNHKNPFEIFTWSKPPAIGNWEGITFLEGGFSGLCYIPGTGNEFYVINDRGPNLVLKDSLHKDDSIKLFPFPHYSQKLIRIRVAEGKIEALRTITIKPTEKKFVSGLPLSTLLANDHKETAWKNLQGDVIEADEWGLDAEAIALENDSIVWIGDEYRPAFWKVNTNTGKVLSVTGPSKGFQTEHLLPSAFLFRDANRGFEALALTPQKKIAALLQSPIRSFGEPTRNNTRLSRFLLFNPTSGQSLVFIYEMNDSIQGNNIDWKIGDMTAINTTQFLVLEHGKMNGKLMALVYLIDISAATSLSEKQQSLPEKIEQFYDAKTLQAKTGIVSIKKSLILNLTENGYDVSIDKPEGITIINNKTIAIINDNDYGIDALDNNKRISLNTSKTHIYLFILAEELNLSQKK